MPKRKKESNRSETHSKELYVPEQIDPHIESIIRTPELRLIPWAWYVLGRHVAMLPIWLKYAEGNSPVQFPKNHLGIPTAIYLIRRALWLLGPRLPERITSNMVKSCERLELHNDNLAMVQDGETPSSHRLFGTADEAIGSLRRSVRGLFSGTNYSRPWLVFGIQLGDFWTGEHDRERDLAQCAEDLINICGILPALERDQVPVIKQIVEVPTVESGTIRSFVHRIIGICRPGWKPRVIETENSESIRHPNEVELIKPSSNVELIQTDKSLQPETNRWNSYEFVAFDRGVWELGNGIEDQLLLRTAPPVEDAKPKWNKITGRLTFEAQLAREVAPQASTIVSVLDAFEEEGWPEKIESSIPRIDRQAAGVNRWRNEKLEGERLHETVRQLNKGLAILRFRGDGTGQGIRWEVAYSAYPF